MTPRLIPLLLVLPAGAALAQYKCTSASGAVSFQQAPCAGGQTQRTLDVVPNGHPPPASGPATFVAPPGPSVDQRMLANYERDRERDGLVQALREARDQQARRAAERQQAVDAATRQAADDPAALRDALAAVASRYGVLGRIDEEHVDDARAALDRWDAARAPAPAASAP